MGSRSTPPHTPLNSSFHPWGPTTVPPAPKIASRARPLPPSRPLSDQRDPLSDAPSSSSATHPLATAVQLSSRMTCAMHQDDQDMTMHLDDVHPQPSATAYTHALRRDSASSSSFSDRSSSEFFIAGAVSSSSSRTTLSESPALHNRSSSRASKFQHGSLQNSSPRFGHVLSEARIPHDPMNSSSPLFSDLQPAFTPLPARRYLNRNRRAASPNEPMDSDEEERLCLRFDPAMLHRSPEFRLSGQLNPTFSIQNNATADRPAHVLQEIQQDVEMDVEEESPVHPYQIDSRYDSEVTLTLDSAGPSLDEHPTLNASATPESPALRTRSRTRMAAAAAAAAAASASAAMSRHTKSGSASSQANVPVRMSSLSTILNTASQQEPQAASVEPAGHAGKSQRKQTGQTPLAVRTRRQTQREREERNQQLPQRTPLQAQSRQQSIHSSRLNALPSLVMDAATLSCASSSQTISPRQKQRNGRMRAFDPTPSPSAPSPGRAALHAAAARRSKSPSPYYSLPTSSVSMAAAYAHHGGAYDPTSIDSYGMDEEHVLNPTFPLPLGGGRNGPSHSNSRMSWPRRMTSRWSPGR
ncbi:hypothetical protein OC846_005764 [Tilletia horrida]|uniref:Uncharacterized protein n=1 Tax=Tilletia horrida TaxID=155126 RepID=A0AAN6GPX9_9BASI|nr:hypothetical protein OC845_005895 [Tilletia horrida]KAK0545204.1 hypothetical protein OC846_005764 [Tilletia horrida]